MVDLERLGREMLAAGLGCAIADGTLNGLEVTKVKMQLDSATEPVYPRSMLGTIRQCVAEDGALRGLCLPGLAATTLRAMTYVAFRVGTYPTVRGYVSGGRDSQPTLGSQLLAGAITGGVGACLFCPIDVVRIRMQADAGTLAAGSTGPTFRTGLRRGLPLRYPTTLGAFGRIARQEGVVGGLYRGAGATVARATLLSSSQLGSYDALKGACKRWLGAAEGLPLHLSCSLMSGIIAQTVIQPVDTARTHIMQQGAATSVGAMVRQEGPLWLYRGFSAACWRQGPIMLVQMPLVEQLRLLLGVGAF